MNIEKYWSNFFGIDPKTFDQVGLHIVPHSSLEDYWGVWIFDRDGSVIVSSPEKFLPICKDLISAADPSSLCDSEVAAKYLAPHYERIIGPAYHGSLDADDFAPVDVLDGREISSDEVSALNDGSDPTGWDWSGCGKEKEHHFGIFHDGTLAAAANYSIKDDVVAFPGVFTHPSFRGLGLAKPALTLAFQHSLSAGLLMDYQTLCSNVGAIKAAESLGVKEFARHVAVRLSPTA